MEDSTAEAVVLAPDDEVVARAQRGEEAAFERLYRGHSPRVYSLCLWMLGDEMEAQRLTQEAFLQAFRKIRSFRCDAAFSTWLCGTTVTLVLTRLRESASSGEGCLDEITPPDEVGGGSHEIEGLPRSRRTPMDCISLESAIRDLQAGHRLVFVLHDVFGYPHDQIAAFLGCSPGKSKSRLHQARLGLRALLCGTSRPDPLSAEAMLKQEEQAR